MRAIISSTGAPRASASFAVQSENRYAGTQLPWKPYGTRFGMCTRAMGSPPIYCLHASPFTQPPRPGADGAAPSKSRGA